MSARQTDTRNAAHNSRQLTHAVLVLRTEAMAAGIMLPPVEPITNVFAGDLSTEGAMEDGGRSPENGRKANLSGNKLNWEI